MAPAIELPGEASPLTHRHVVDALVLAASSTQQQVQTGTKQLENWERQALYHVMLQVCFDFKPTRNTFKLTHEMLGCLSRPFPPHRSSISRYYSIEARYRPILAQDSHQVCFEPETAAQIVLGYALTLLNSAISKDEKAQIKTRALEAGIEEPARPLALQNALMVAKILRYEFPHDW
jgi:hypothetical protein